MKFLEFGGFYGIYSVLLWQLALWDFSPTSFSVSTVESPPFLHLRCFINDFHLFHLPFLSSKFFMTADDVVDILL